MSIRPPAEANSFLLQVTSSCSANSCTFCGAYLNQPFKIINTEAIFSDIEREVRYYPATRKVFLMDGDALVLNNEKLIPILQKLNNSFPKLTRISSYANGYNITSRSEEELNELYNNKLKLIYMGLESGDQDILDKCHKKSTADEMIKAVQRATKARIKSSVIVLLGLGGKKDSLTHAIKSAEAINQMQPRYLNLLSLMLVPGTPLYQQEKEGSFEVLNAKELLIETYEIIKRLELKQTIFRCNHASNYLPLEGRFPQDKNRLLSIIESAIQGKIGLKPELFRGL